MAENGALEIGVKTMKAIRRFPSVGLIILAILLPNVGSASSEDNSKAVVLQFLDAYNDHDVDGMLELCAEDIRWLTVMGDSIYVEASGKSELGPQLNEHFATSPATHSKFLQVEGNGPMVVGIEQASSSREAGARTQCSASVYQLVDGLIKDVWYFDAYECGEMEDSEE